MSELPPSAARIRALTELVAPPLVPELRLHLATPSCPLWHASEADLGALGVPEPYWAFCWGGGQALARHVLDHPELVRRRRVLDVGAGGGVVAIAAARAGAALVGAVDVDPWAVAAVEINASVNHVDVEARSGDPLGAPAVGWDVIFAGDVSYDPALARRLVDWMGVHVQSGGVALLADLGRGHLPAGRLTPVADFAAPSDVAALPGHRKRATVYRVLAPSAAPNESAP